MKYLLFDIGGTKSRFATTDGRDVGELTIIDTPQNFDEALQAFGNAALSLTDDGFELAYGGLAGPLTKDRTGLYEPENLPHWHNRNFVEGLSSLINSPVYIENDTALVGVGEATHGVGAGHEIVMYMTISTGVNAVKISHQQIDEASVGFETGKQIIDISEHLDMATVNMGSLEEFISGKHIEQKYGKLPSDIDDEKLWRQIAEYTAVGIYNSILHWSPDIVILGGGMMKKIPLDIVHQKTTELVTKILPDYPDIVEATLGEKGGLYGALEMINRN